MVQRPKVKGFPDVPWLTRPATPAEAAAAFPGARADTVANRLDALGMVGAVRKREDGRYEGVGR